MAIGKSGSPTVAPGGARPGASDAVERDDADDLATSIEKMGARSVSDVDALIYEFQSARDYLEAEAARVNGEVARYSRLCMMASDVSKLVAAKLQNWRSATRPK